MRHIMKHAVIVSGGNINTDFALDFLKKNTDFFSIFYFFPAELWGVNTLLLSSVREPLYGPPGWVGGEGFWQ